MSDISLNANIRSTLQSLKEATHSFDESSQRLASGKKVNSAVDNPTNYYASVNLRDRAAGLTARLDDMSQSIQQIKAADHGITTVRSFISAMKGVVNNALGNTDSNSRLALGKQFNELIVQMNTTAIDSSYGGVNLLRAHETTKVQFNETFDESTLEVEGFNIGGPGGTNVSTADASGALASAGGFAGYNMTTVSESGAIVTTEDAAIAISVQGSNTAYGIQSAATDGSALSHEASWVGTDYKEVLTGTIQELELFDKELKIQATKLAQNLASITIREEFSMEIIDTLQEGSDDLVLSDQNEDGAKLLAAQTRSQIATQALSLLSQQTQQVLQLLG